MTCPKGSILEMQKRESQGEHRGDKTKMTHSGGPFSESQRVVGKKDHQGGRSRMVWHVSTMGEIREMESSCAMSEISWIIGSSVDLTGHHAQVRENL